MDRDIAERWVRALRSGDYEQTQGQLRRGRVNAQFCCLGVLCNLHAQAHPEIAKGQRSSSSYLGESGALPSAVRRWAGIKSSNGAFDLTIKEQRNFGSGPTMTLVALNDAHNYGFLKIAKTIEKHWKAL